MKFFNSYRVVSNLIKYVNEHDDVHLAGSENSYYIKKGTSENIHFSWGSDTVRFVDEDLEVKLDSFNSSRMRKFFLKKEMLSNTDTEKKAIEVSKQYAIGFKDL